MPDDYADSARRRDAYKKRKKPQPRTSNGRYKDDRFGWILPLIVLIIFVTGLFYFKFHQNHNATAIVNESTMHASQPATLHQEVPVRTVQANWSSQQQYLKAKTTAPATPVTTTTASAAIQAPITNQTIDAQPATAQNPNAQTVAQTTDQANTDPPPAKAAANQKYDYYNMLPKMQVGQPTDKRERADDDDTDNNTDTDTDDATIDNPVNMKASADIRTPSAVAAVKPASIKAAPLKTIKVKPASVNTTPSTGIYQLQLGAFRNRTQAQALIDRLRDHHLPLQITVVQYNNTAWYRVIAGPYASAAKAQQMQKTLRAAGIDSIARNP